MAAVAAEHKYEPGEEFVDLTDDDDDDDDDDENTAQGIKSESPNPS